MNKILIKIKFNRTTTTINVNSRTSLYTTVRSAKLWLRSTTFVQSILKIDRKDNNLILNLKKQYEPRKFYL